MRYIVLSDTHGNKAGLNQLLNKVEHDGVIFCGDGEGDFESLEKNIHMVKGNCDFFSKLPSSVSIEICGHKLFITHGNMYGVKSGMGSLMNEAEKEGANIVIFGHTHIPYIQQINNITYLNPGSFKKGISSKSSYATLDFVDNKFFINIVEF